MHHNSEDSFRKVWKIKKLALCKKRIKTFKSIIEFLIIISKCGTYGNEQWHYSQTNRSHHLPGRRVPTNKAQIFTNCTNSRIAQTSCWPPIIVPWICSALWDTFLLGNVTYLAQREVFQEDRTSICLPEGEGRGSAGNFETSTTILGSNLGLKRPPVLWVSIQSLEHIQKNTINTLQLMTHLHLTYSTRSMVS